ncbi:MAG TPA: serine/threonine-protein kinase [Candidatus Limnocylindrales bacterium]|nr:serine/threonine-protein kinase [Candidatus Limnocylindrales bacterium]
MIAPNTVVGGRYRVMKPLGGGGMKLVYLAEDLRLAARPCALAEMVDTFTSPETQKQAVAAFQREADMLAQLSNEHIPRVFDRFSDQNHHYLVMEYIEGITLEQKINENSGKLPESEVIDVALQVLDTLEYLHNLEPPVIYRDLKPSNVMLTPSEQVKLIDFGIARLFQPLSNATMIGTQGYAPPEQYRGKVEFRSDLYALGATMHHALSGRDPALEPPFSFPALRSLCPDVTPALCDLIDQALKYDVVLRVADAAEFRQRLMAIKSGTPMTAPQRNSPTGKAARPQLKLPLSGVKSKEQQASAPTMLSNAIDTECPRCGRSIPVDSNFCSFCAADVTGRLSAIDRGATPEANTIMLDDVASQHDFPGPIFHERRRRRHPGRTMALVLGGFFLMGYLIFHSSQPQPSDGDTGPDYGSIPSVPNPGAPAPGEPADPPHTQPREIALRRALDMQGYNSVRFKMDGDTIILWGQVPTEADRLMVQTQIFLVARIFSIEDHIQVRDNFFAEP